MFLQILLSILYFCKYKIRCPRTFSNHLEASRTSVAGQWLCDYGHCQYSRLPLWQLAWFATSCTPDVSAVYSPAWLHCSFSWIVSIIICILRFEICCLPIGAPPYKRSRLLLMYQLASLLAPAVPVRHGPLSLIHSCRLYSLSLSSPSSSSSLIMWCK